MKKILILIFAACFLMPDAFPENAVITANLVSDDFSIDGKLDEAFYRDTAPYKLKSFPKKDKLSQETDAWICRDKKNIIIAVKCFESDIGKISKTETQHDGEVFRDDCVEIFISPDSSKRRDYYHLAVTAAGTRYDCDNSPEESDGFSWNPKWQTAVNIADAYWTVEIRIPLAQFLWGKSPAINLCRTRNAGKCEYSTLAELLGGSFHSPDDFLTLKLAGMPCVYIKETAPLTFYPLLQNHGKFQISNQDKKSHRLKFQLAFSEASKAETQFLERDIIMNPESEISFIFDYTIKKKYQNYEFRIVLDEELFFLQKNKIPSAFSLNSPGTIFGSEETLTLFLDSAASYPNKYSYRIYLVMNSGKLLLKDKIPFTAKARAVIKTPETSGNAVSLKIQMLDPADNPVDELERPVTIMTLGK